MKTLLSLFLLLSIILSMNSFANIRCPSEFDFKCIKVADSNKTSCSISLGISKKWIFAPPYKKVPIKKMTITGKIEGQPSILPPGNYAATYSGSYSGPLPTYPQVAYCFYSVSGKIVAVAALYKKDYKKSKGHWKKYKAAFECLGRNCWFKPN